VTATALGVTIVVPVLNGCRWLRPALASIVAQRDGRPFEIIAVDDGSTDGSLRLLRNLARERVLKLLRGEGQGAAAAINAGVRDATQPIVCQVDQDVILQRGWLVALLRVFDDPDVAAAQGHYITRPGAGFWARAMGRDLEHRYSRIRGPFVDHVCTGNTAYRTRALHQVSLLDERLGYGYDNDLSYRLHASGHRLAFCRDAISVHCWREGFRGYLRQQFGVGYGRLDVVARHPRRFTGDDVSGTLMMVHAPAMLVALAALVTAAVVAALDGSWAPSAVVGLALVAGLGVERMAAGVDAWRRSGDRAALAFSIAHLARDIAWAVAIVTWLARWALRHDRGPAHSMHRRAHLTEYGHSSRERTAEVSVLAVVPAFNESANLPRVVADLSRVMPLKDILIVDDGSTDGTPELLPHLGVRWLSLSQRLGVGGAVRAGIRYARRAGYDYVVRIDGDGQHRACDIARMLAPVVTGRADVALGSRFLRRQRRLGGLRRVSQAALAACLSAVTRKRVTDPTSGFWLFGPRALRLLSGHHPAGYAEPELLLFLSRNRLRVAEIPIRMRPRIGGRTSLTGPRALFALARTALALVIVPFRQLVDGQVHD
jgi:glycosyltransferase involved in cell wall biosynthesis